MLRSVVMNASQQSPSSDAVFDDTLAETIYDTWLLRSPSDFDSYLPRSELSVILHLTDKQTERSDTRSRISCTAALNVTSGAAA